MTAGLSGSAAHARIRDRLRANEWKCQRRIESRDRAYQSR